MMAAMPAMLSATPAWTARLLSFFRAPPEAKAAFAGPDIAGGLRRLANGSRAEMGHSCPCSTECWWPPAPWLCPGMLRAKRDALYLAAPASQSVLQAERDHAPQGVQTGLWVLPAAVPGPVTLQPSDPLQQRVLVGSEELRHDSPVRHHRRHAVERRGAVAAGAGVLRTVKQRGGF